MQTAMEKSPVVMPIWFQQVESQPGPFEGCAAFVSRSNLAFCMCFCTERPETEAMPYDKGLVIDAVHSFLGEKQGLVEVETGRTARGAQYVYSIVKSAIEPSGMQYIVSANIDHGQTCSVIQGYFEEEGTTGMRDAAVFAMTNADIKNGWFADPYDADFTQGLLMNQAEAREYDVMFPEHPLSMAREFLENVIADN